MRIGGQGADAVSTGGNYLDTPLVGFSVYSVVGWMDGKNQSSLHFSPSLSLMTSCSLVEGPVCPPPDPPVNP